MSDDTLFAPDEGWSLAPVATWMYTAGCLIGAPLLTSAEFARLVKRPMKSVGRHDLRGVAAAQELFTPEQDYGSATGSAH
jgi:hypothetical protein